MTTRYYDPQLGRFLSADPLVQDPGDPQTLNRFAYVQNNPLRFADPSGLEGVPAFDPVTFVLANVAAFFISRVVFGKRNGQSPPSRPPGPIQATAFSPLAAPPLPTSFPNSAAALGTTSAPGLTEAEIAARDVPIEPIGLLEDPFFNVGLFFSGPMLRGLGWAGRTGQGLLLSERGAVQIASAASKAGTRQIILKAGTELARTFGTEAGQATAEGGFFMTQSALRRIGLKMGMSPETLKEALNLSGRNPATRLGLFRVVKDIPAKIRPIAGGLVNEIVVRKPFRGLKFLEFLEETVVRLR